jgi:ribosomal protein S18
MKKSYKKSDIDYILILKYFNNIIDYKNIKLLSVFLTEDGKIYNRKETGLTNKQQHLISKNIKKARDRGLIPYTFNIKLN